MNGPRRLVFPADDEEIVVLQSCEKDGDDVVVKALVEIKEFAAVPVLVSPPFVYKTPKNLYRRGKKIVHAADTTVKKLKTEVVVEEEETVTTWSQIPDTESGADTVELSDETMHELGLIESCEFEAYNLM